MTLQVIVGGQYGSEGKGAIAGWLAADLDDLIAVRVAGPNAGHTVIGRCPPDCTDAVMALTSSASDPAHGEVRSGRAHYSDRHPWRLRQVPVAAVTAPDALLCIGQGSEIDPRVLRSEIEELDAAGYKVSSRIWIDAYATVIEPRHHQLESANRVHPEEDPDFANSLVARLGSTGKGIGAARADRVMRSATLAQDHPWLQSTNRLAVTSEFIRERLQHHGNVQIEGTQGYQLGQHAGNYPYCTSSDCTAIDFLSMAGAPPWLVPRNELEVWVVFRTFPIRVAGNSGPLPYETSWGEVGQPEELTTVTQRVRRVARWDAQLARYAMLANGSGGPPGGPVRAALTMVDYVVPGIAGAHAIDSTIDPSIVTEFYQAIARHSKDLGSLVRLAGTGPDSVIDLRGLDSEIRKAY